MSVFNTADFSSPAVTIAYLQANYTNNTVLAAELAGKAPLAFTGASGANAISFPTGEDDAFHFTGTDNVTYMQVDTNAKRIYFGQDGFDGIDVNAMGDVNMNCVNLVANNNLEVQGNSTLDNDLEVKGNSTADGNLEVKGDTTLAAATATDVTATTVTGSTSVTGGGVIISSQLVTSVAGDNLSVGTNLTGTILLGNGSGTSVMQGKASLNTVGTTYHVTVPSNSAAAGAGVPVNGLYRDEADPAHIYIRTA